MIDRNDHVVDPSIFINKLLLSLLKYVSIVDLFCFEEKSKQGRGIS